MTIIISGNNNARHQCDYREGCTQESENMHYVANVAEIDEPTRRKGWFISFSDDKSYCPKHSPYRATH